MALILQYDGSVEPFTLGADGLATLADLQEAVGGFIEVVPLNGREGWAYMVVNEHGKFEMLPPNVAATRLIHGLINDVIVGNVVLLRDGEID